MTEEKKYYTIPEVALVLGIGYLQARRLVKLGRIRSVDLTTRIDNKKNICVLKQDLVDYINKTVRVK